MRIIAQVRLTVHALGLMAAFGLSAAVLGLLGSSTPLGSGAFGQADVPVAVVVNAASNVRELDEASLAAIFSGRRRFWSTGKPIMAFSAPPGSSLRVTFDRAVLKMSPDEVGRYWVEQSVRSGARPPRQVPNASLALRVVGASPTAVGYVPLSLVTGDKVRVVAIIRDGAVHKPR